MKYQKIMKAAHEMTRETLKRFPEANYRVTLAAALRIAWEDARREDSFAAAAARLAVAVVLQSAADAVTRRAADTSAAAAELAAELPKLYDEMPLAAALSAAAASPAAGAELYARLKRAAAAAPRRMLSLVRYLHDEETGESRKMYYCDSRCFWALPRAYGGLELMPWEDAVDTIAAELFVVLSEKASDEWEDKPLKYALHSGAVYAVARCERGVRDRARRAKKTEARADAAPLESPDGIPGYHAPAPEAVAIARARIDALPADDDDKRIINGLMLGKTQKEIAAALGKSQGFISKRITRMKTAEARREEEAEAALVKAWLDGDDLRKPARVK